MSWRRRRETIKLFESDEKKTLHDRHAVADLGLVVWGPLPPTQWGGGEHFNGAPKIQVGAKLTNLVN